jgi:hypothetical protein
LQIRAVDCLSRREFLGLAATLIAAPGWARLARAPVHIAFIRSAELAFAAQAAAMSAAEAERAARLLRREFRFTTLTDTTYRAVRPEWTGIIRASKRNLNLPDRIPVVDIASAPACERNVFYLRPQVPLAVWHESLERFGAGQLNARFRAAGITRIEDQAWLGWFAVKCLWEAGLRSKQLNEMSFDGQKGRALVFNRAGSLLQPLYELSPDKTKVIAERMPTSEDREAACAR